MVELADFDLTPEQHKQHQQIVADVKLATLAALERHGFGAKHLFIAFDGDFIENPLNDDEDSSIFSFCATPQDHERCLAGLGLETLREVMSLSGKTLIVKFDTEGLDHEVLIADELIETRSE